MIKALILDLDNTVYPVNSIANELFKPMYDFLDQNKEAIGEENLQEIKTLLMKKAWQKIAGQFNISEELVKQGSDILRELTCEMPMQTFADYELVKNLPHDKFLVTMGFTNMQQSKVKMLRLENDFIDISINDPEKTEDTKKEIFEEILQKYNYAPNEVLVIGDDPDSEIKAEKILTLQQCYTINKMNLPVMKLNIT